MTLCSSIFASLMKGKKAGWGRRVTGDLPPLDTHHHILEIYSFFPANEESFILKKHSLVSPVWDVGNLKRIGPSEKKLIAVEKKKKIAPYISSEKRRKLGRDRC